MWKTQHKEEEEIEIEIWPFEQVIDAHSRTTILENEMHKILWDFEIQTDHLLSARQTVNNNKKK